MPVKMIIKKSTKNKFWRGCGGKREPSYIVGENVNWYITGNSIEPLMKMS